MSCRKCKRASYLNLSLCQECWRNINELPETFRKKKEKTLRDKIIQYLIEHYHIKTEWDKCIKGTKFRPDMHFNTLHYGHVIIEIDENSHKYYKREVRRYEILKKNLRCLKIIRINVDSYKEGKKKYPSIWSKKTIIKEDTNIIETYINTNYEELERRWEIIKNTLSKSLDPRCKRVKWNLFY